jgi:uncharacterized membrane protein YhhN
MDIRKNNVLNGVLYALATTGTIVGELHDHHLLVYVCKPLMMIVLSSWFFFNSRRVGDRFTLLIQAGLFFSLIGDVALMFQHLDQFNFLIGLAAFFIAQLCYTIAFVHNIADVGGGGNFVVSGILTVLLGAYGFFFASRLLPYVEEGISVPLLVYAVTITAMGIAASFRFARTFLRSFLMVLVGALFFIASDSLLATNRFMRPLDHAGWSIILTYAIAQYLIAAGCLAHVLDPEEIRRKAALST